MPSQKEKGRGPKPVLTVRARPASQVEAERMARALDRLLAECIRQGRAHRSFANEEKQDKPH